MLSGTHDFDGEVLAETVRRTFSRRGTPVTADSMVFGPAFAGDLDKQVQWTAFVGRPGLKGAPSLFSDVASAVSAFLRPVARAIATEGEFKVKWKAPGPWM